MMQAQEAAQAAWRRERVVESKAAIDQFSEGVQVTAIVKGDKRDATVIKVGRSRLTVRFRIKSGAERTALLYARDVQPA
jgi:hypothetical protein